MQHGSIKRIAVNNQHTVQHSLEWGNNHKQNMKHKKCHKTNQKKNPTIGT